MHLQATEASCGRPSVWGPAGGVGEFTDYYLYITSQEDEHCAAGAVAWALPCKYSATTNRPILGAANLCPSNMMNSTVDEAVSVLTHELTHALVSSWGAAASAAVWQWQVAGACGWTYLPALCAAHPTHPPCCAGVQGFTDDSFDKFIDASGDSIPKAQVGRGRWAAGTMSRQVVQAGQLRAKAHPCTACRSTWGGA